MVGGLSSWLGPSWVDTGTLTGGPVFFGYVVPVAWRLRAVSFLLTVNVVWPVVEERYFWFCFYFVRKDHSRVER